MRHSPSLGDTARRSANLFLRTDTNLVNGHTTIRDAQSRVEEFEGHDS